MGNRFAAGHWRFKGHMAGRTRGSSGMTGIALFVAAFFSYHSGMCTGSQKFEGLGGQNVPHNCASACGHAALTSSFLDETRCAETWGYVLPAAPFGARRAGMTRCTDVSFSAPLFLLPQLIVLLVARARACFAEGNTQSEITFLACFPDVRMHARARAKNRLHPSLPPPCE